MAAHQRHLASNAGGSDTTYTKIFVGGLAWETQRDALRGYFEQFGEILEAVVIADKYTGRSKGYGFVTFKDPDSAMRACIDPAPVIDGRRANCNLASTGATQRQRPPTSQHYRTAARFRPVTVASALSFRGSSAVSPAATAAYFHQAPQYAFQYPLYGYSGGYTQEGMYPLGYYSGGGGGGGGGGGSGAQHHHQFSPYYQASAAGPVLVHSGFYPYYPHYSQTSHGSGGLPLQYQPYFPQNYGAGTGILSLPTSIAANTAAGSVMAPLAPPIAPSPSQQPSGLTPDYHHST